MIEEQRAKGERVQVGFKLTSEEFSEVLHRGNEQILNGLLPKSAPSGALEAMRVGGIGKAALNEVLSALEISPSSRGMSQAPGFIEPVLVPVPNDGST